MFELLLSAQLYQYAPFALSGRDYDDWNERLLIALLLDVLHWRLREMDALSFVDVDKGAALDETMFNVANSTLGLLWFRIVMRI